MNRVEYLKKTKYENQLPPPPFAPKLVDYGLKLDALLSAGSLSAVYLQSELEPEVDSELGVPVDFTASAEQFFEGGAQRERAMVFADQMDAPLDDEDAELLKDAEPSGVLARAGQDGVAGASSGTLASAGLAAPADAFSGGAPPAHGSAGGDSGDSGVSTSEIGIGTSFLRRTAYMTSEMRRASKRKAAAGSGGSRSDEQPQQRVEREIKRIERTFADARAPLSSLRHPKKPQLKAVSAAPILPDAKVSDLSFVEVRLLGSASLKALSAAAEHQSHGSSNGLSTAQLRSAVFLQQKLPEEVGGDNVSDWLSMFVPGADDEAEQLTARRLELKDTLSVDEMRQQEEAVWPLQRVQDADLTLLRPKTRFEEVVFSHDSRSGAFLYIPVSARINLRRRRVDPRVRDELREMRLDVDELELGLKEPTTQESIERDEVRSIYDPVRFG